jgi:hypothetical protein
MARTPRRLEGAEFPLTLAFRAFGRAICVRSQEAWILERLLARLPPSAEVGAHPEPERLYSVARGADGELAVFAGARRVAQTPDDELAADLLEADVHMYLAQEARERIFVHAGVVAFAGRAIVIPGRTMSGKSTLTSALLRAGGTYYSDEYAVFRRDGWVEPYARLLSMRQGPGLRPQRCGPEVFGARAGTEAIPVAVFALSRFHAGATWRPRLLSSGHGLLALLKNTVAARKRAPEALAHLSRALEGARVLKGKRGDADETARSLRSLVLPGDLGA